MMLVFMATITWTWWINRQGTLYWNLDPHPFWDIRCSPEKRNRTVHILKNVSIVGALTILQQLAKYESQASDCSDGHVAESRGDSKSELFGRHRP